MCSDQVVHERRHELQEITTTNHNDHNDEQAEATGHQLPACDGGPAAWRLLLAAFVFEALLWGFPLSFGVFQRYYAQLPEFKDSPYISVVGTTASGMSYLAAPIAIPLTKRFAKYRRHMIAVGWPICLLGLIAGSFAQSLGTLILTQGFMYGLGFIIFYYPILSMVNEFWIARRGMAYGFLCSASGVSGAAMPFCLEKLLQKYGYATTLRVIAVGLFVLTGPLIPLLKGRVPEAGSGTFARADFRFLTKPTFWIYSASNLAMSLGYFFPGIYLPSYASATGLPSIQGALLLALMSVSQVAGQFTFGYLSDKKISINLLTVVCTLSAGVAAYTSWGLAHSFGVLVVFALVYGFFGTGYTAMWARMGSKVSDDPVIAFTAFGLLNVGKGIGNILAGPIGGALLKSAVNKKDYGAAKYESIVLFTASCMVVSAIPVALTSLKPPRWFGGMLRTSR